MKKRRSVGQTAKAAVRRSKTKTVRLVAIAHARSGDKGDTANVGLIALKPQYYPVLVKQVTAPRRQAF
jgi:hypothetical protein